MVILSTEIEQCFSAMRRPQPGQRDRYDRTRLDALFHGDVMAARLNDGLESVF